jgi:hypothetical protein
MNMPDAVRAIAEFVGLLAGLAICALIYFLPAIIAAHRRLKQGREIGWLNLFLGWTAGGWVVLLIVAFVLDAPRGAPVRSRYAAHRTWSSPPSGRRAK